MVTERNQPHAEETQVEQPVQEPVAPVEPEAGAEITQETPERTYTEAEWNKRQSALDTQAAAQNKRIVQMEKERDTGSVQRQIDEMVRQDTVQQQADQKAVEEGLITPVEAEQKRQQRQTDAQTRIQSQVQVQQAQRIISEGEQTARMQTAQDFVKKYGLEETLIGALLDASITTPAQMEAKATNLALEKTQGELKKAQKAPQHFDQGQQSSGEGSEEKSLKERYPSMYKKK